MEDIVWVICFIGLIALQYFFLRLICIKRGQIGDVDLAHDAIDEFEQRVQESTERSFTRQRLVLFNNLGAIDPGNFASPPI